MVAQKLLAGNADPGVVESHVRPLLCLQRPTPPFSELLWATIFHTGAAVSACSGTRSDVNTTRSQVTNTRAVPLLTQWYQPVEFVAFPVG